MLAADGVHLLDETGASHEDVDDLVDGVVGVDGRGKNSPHWTEGEGGFVLANGMKDLTGLALCTYVSKVESDIHLTI